MKTSILVGGRPRPIPLDVRTWHQTGFEFPALPRRTETRLGVLHHTGGEGGGQQVYHVLKNRNLSVHFCVDQEGVVWQYADADARCSHAGFVNSYSWGIEFSNSFLGVQRNIWNRPVYEECFDGSIPFKAKGLTDAQVHAGDVLVRTLCTCYGLPYSAPAAKHQMHRSFWENYRGVAGHFHIKGSKVDPGTQALVRLGLV